LRREKKKKRRSSALNLLSIPHTHHIGIKGQPKRLKCRFENQCLAIRRCCTCYPHTDAHTFLIIFIFNKNIKLLFKEIDYKKKEKRKKIMESSLTKFAFRYNLVVLPLKKKVKKTK